MAIVGGLDIHRRQITYDWIDTTTGETRRGQLSPATRLELRAWLARFTGQQADFAFEGTTGWRFVAEEVMDAGFRAYLAEPADTRALRGPKRRAKTDRADAHHLRELLRAGTLPQSWMPPAHVADARTQVGLRRALVGERTGWQQRIHPILFHHGLPERSQLLTADGRAWLARVELPAVARQAVELALRMIDHLDTELDLLDTELARIARVQPGGKALQRGYGIGWLTAVAIWAEFGDVRRFANSRQAVRFTGLDITITESDGKRARGHLARQAPRCCAGRCPKQPCAPPARALLTTPITSRSDSAWAASGLRCRWPASSPARPTTPCANSATRRWSRSSWPPPPERAAIVRAWMPGSLLWCGWLPDAPAAMLVMDGLHRTSGRARPVREPDHPSCRRTWSEHRDKAGHPRVTLPAVHSSPRQMR
jgi:transposase